MPPPLRPLVLRLLVALHRRLTTLLPRLFREGWMEHAEDDLRRALDAVRGRHGTAVAAIHGLAACLDVARAVPREWWKEATGDRRSRGRGSGMGWDETMTNALREMRVAARSLARRPGYTATAATTLALGIGATVAIFTVVNAVLLRPLPYPEADRLVTINHHAPGLNLPTLNNSDGTLNFYWAEADFLEGLAAWGGRQHNLVGGPEPERVRMLGVSPQFFDVFRIAPALGRFFNADDAAEGAPPVALLTHAAWRTRFGRDPAVLGRTLDIDGVTTEVVGVLPEGFAFPTDDPVAYVPLRVDPNGTFGRFGMASVGRLAPGVSLDEAQRRAEQLQARLPEYFPDLASGFLDQAGWSVSVEGLQEFLVGEDVSSSLWIVLGTVGFVFLIACANVANLFLVRAESRQRELAVRAAMGAGYGRLASGFLAEAILLGFAGGALGVALAWGGVRLLVRFGPQELPRLDEVAVDVTTLAFAAGLSLAAALLFGAIPLVRFAGGAVAGQLGDGGRANTHGRERHRTRNALVAAQLALALVLLVGAGLMARSFQALRSLDPGVDPRDVLAVGLSLGEGVPNAEAASFYQQVADEVAALPGVTAVGLSSLVPLGGGSSNGGSFYIESKPRVEGALPPVAMYKAVGGDYLGALRQPLLAGRALDRSDWEGGAPVALVNQAFADAFLDGDALGQGIKWDEDQDFARVVGVVADARERSLREDPEPWAYLPMRVGAWPYPDLEQSSLLIRSAPGTPVSPAAVRDLVARLAPTVPITAVRSMEEVVSHETAGTSFTLVLLGIASAVALFLGSIGLFGVITYVVSQRTREIGVRVALGARGEDIQGMFFRQSALVAALGVTVGLLGAAALTRVMGSVLYGVSSLDPLSFAMAPVVLLAVAFVATWLPARRASRVDPVEALRTE
ncbi:MAG: hypothetical protein AMXMBFR53_06600 [Gemmatimonadota bacterium]